MSSKNRQTSVKTIQLVGRIIAATCLLVAAGVWLWPSGPSSTGQTETSETQSLVSYSSIEPTDVDRDYDTKPIDQIRVGDRVLAHNPEVTDVERASWEEPDWSDWLHLSLVMPKEDGSELKIELLRPESWVMQQVCYIVEGQEIVSEKPLAARSTTNEPITTSSNTSTLAPRASCLPAEEGLGVSGPASASASPNTHTTNTYSDLIPYAPVRPFFRNVALTSAVLDASDLQLVGLSVEMDLHEMGATGTAVITDIAPCPPIRLGEGQPVTATFSHPPSTKVLDVLLESETTPIGVTDNHLFWSVDRERFFPIGKMEIGERVQSFHGDTKRIEAKLPRPGPQVVYNLEVYGEHVYFVGEQGLLAHNEYIRNGPNSGELVYRGGGLRELQADAAAIFAHLDEARDAGIASVRVNGNVLNTSLNKRGPTLSLVADAETGLMTARQNVPNNVRAVHQSEVVSRRVAQGAGPEFNPEIPSLGRNGNHGEVVGMDELLTIRRSLNLPVDDEAVFQNFLNHNIHIRSRVNAGVVAGTQQKRCSNCRFLTRGMTELFEN